NECKVTNVFIKRYNDPAPTEPKDARQVVFQFCVSEQVCDIFFNAPDGLRGRYWQSPTHGFVATRNLIGELSERLLSFAQINPPVPCAKAAPMKLDSIAASLSAPSAKIWPCERDNQGENLLLKVPPATQLIIPRWIENELHASFNAGMWRRT